MRFVEGLRLNGYPATITVKRRRLQARESQRRAAEIPLHVAGLRQDLFAGGASPATPVEP